MVFVCEPPPITNEKEIAALKARKAYLEAALKQKRKEPKKVLLKKEDEAVRVRAKLELAPLLLSNGVPVFQERPPVLSLPVGSKCNFVNRLPRPEDETVKELKSREDAFLERMRQELDVSAEELAELESLLVHKHQNKSSVFFKRRKIGTEKLEPLNEPLTENEALKKAKNAALQAEEQWQAAARAAKRACATIQTKKPSLISVRRRWSIENLTKVLVQIGLSLSLAAWQRWSEYTRKCIIHEKLRKYHRYQGEYRIVWAWFNCIIKNYSRWFRRWKLTTLKIKQHIHDAARLKCAACFQSLFRVQRAKKILEEKRRAHHHQVCTVAALLLQRNLRAYTARQYYISLLSERKRKESALFLQTHFCRIVLATQKVNALRLADAQAKAIPRLQRFARDYKYIRAARIHTNALRRHRKATDIQRILWRGQRGRLQAAQYAQYVKHTKYVTLLQRTFRIFLARQRMERIRVSTALYVRQSKKYAIRMQAIYRGNQARMLLAIRTRAQKLKEQKRIRIALFLQSSVRKFFAVKHFIALKAEINTRLISEAKRWIQIVDQNTAETFFQHTTSGRTSLTPPQHYTNIDGDFSLAWESTIIENPIKSMSNEERLKYYADLRCAECEETEATRLCDQCQDKFCAQCYAAVHAAGRRARHTYTVLDVAECGECDADWATIHCRSCDDFFCTTCFDKIHTSKSAKRANHNWEPYAPGEKAAGLSI